MIQITVEYSIYCDKCGETLAEKDGYNIKEGNAEHIKEVAKSYGWKINGDVHLCKKCL